MIHVTSSNCLSRFFDNDKSSYRPVSLPRDMEMEIKRGYTVSYTERVALLCARGCVAYATCRGIDPAPAISRAESFRIGIGSVFPREDASRLPPRPALLERIAPRRVEQSLGRVEGSAFAQRPSRLYLRSFFAAHLLLLRNLRIAGVRAGYPATWPPCRFQSPPGCRWVQRLSPLIPSLLLVRATKVS